MINLTLKQAKFKFSERVILNRTEKGTRKRLRTIGAMVRNIARNSMKKRQSPSPPGKPPRVIDGKLKKFLFYVVDRAESVTVGPVKLAETGTPRILEMGGIKINRRRKAGRRILQKVSVKPRPYMAPANRIAADNYQEVFKNAFR